MNPVISAVRPVVLADAIIPTSDRGRLHYFDTSVVALRAIGTGGMLRET